MIRRACALLLALPALLGAQQRDALDSLADATTRAIVRYADRSVASADGYLRIGPDFPGMGEHWLHPAMLLGGRLDATRPTLLIYAAIGNAPVLLGAGFVTTTRDSAPASGVPGWPAAWHEHSGLLADESGLSPGTHESRTHVWVLHVWAELPNPHGRFAPDNWALPFARVGLKAPPHVDVDVARALALVTTGDRYLRDLLTDAGLRDSTNAARVDAVIADARTRVTAHLDRGWSPEGTPRADAAMRDEWITLERALLAMLGPSVGPLLAPPHSARFDQRRHEDHDHHAANRG
jgi:hypothetical protein